MWPFRKKQCPADMRADYEAIMGMAAKEIEALEKVIKLHEAQLKQYAAAAARLEQRS